MPRRIQFRKLKVGQDFKWGSIDPHFRKLDETSAVRIGRQYIGKVYAFGDHTLVHKSPKSPILPTQTGNSRIQQKKGVKKCLPLKTRLTLPPPSKKSGKKPDFAKNWHTQNSARPFDVGILISTGYEQSDCNDEGTVDFDDAIRIMCDDGYVPPTSAQRGHARALWNAEFPSSRVMKTGYETYGHDELY